MLNQESLQQLKGLKSQLEAQKERAEAVVKGTQARYGFAVLDDGREIFIPPQEMLKAFPDDRVRICIRPTKDNKSIADIEKLVDSPLADFTGRCVRKGKAMFVAPDLPHLSRWLFIPPHARNGVKEGDYVRCAILRHPIRDGKPQAKILAVLGDDSTPGIENLYCMAKYRLPGEWQQPGRKALASVLENANPLEDGNRRDLTDLAFISIDAAKTLDIDDALYCENSNDGWQLHVAIADPTAYIRPDSDVMEDIAARATSVYFHGDVLPMLPEELSQDTCALTEGADRPALVCRMTIGEAGDITEFEFFEASIRSRAKLSYYAVDRYLNGQFDELMSHATPLEPLYQVYRALRANREQHCLVMEDRQEYRWILGDDKQIENIEPYDKLMSQRIVEECMVAANRCAARLLSEKKAAGPYVVHPGFRSDRRDELQKFLDMHAPDVAGADPTTVAGYREIIARLTAPEHALPLRAMVNRLMTRAELSQSAAPHMGMALDAYTNCTSPLRKYIDFLVHLQIKAILSGQDGAAASEEHLASVGESINACRSATFEADRWLAGNYLEKLAARDSGSFRARVTHVTSGGFNLRLEGNGLEGNVDLRQDPEKFSYDKWTASLTSTTRRFALNQAVDVKFLGIDRENQSTARFELIPGCGLKPPKETEDTPSTQEAPGE